MLLIFPPIAKACEPPAGVARLAASLRDAGIDCRILDGNLEGQLFLLRHPQTAEDTWTRRAIRNREKAVAALRDISTFSTPDRYSRAVHDLGRLLAVASAPRGVAGLADYTDAALSPVRSADLLAAAGFPESNPFYGWFSRRLPEIMEESAPRAVGFSLNYLSQAICTFAMIGFLRQISPATKIILGGGLVTSWMRRPRWQNPFAGLVDHTVDGAGEEPLADICGVSPGRTALPAYDILPVQDYLSPGLILPYSAASGCYWNDCSFCPERAEGTPYSPIPVSRARSELRSLVNATKPALIHLLDNAISPALMRSFALEPLGVPWYGFARIGDDLADPDFCRALKRSGCVMLKLGLESGDQGVLDALRKGVRLEQASLVLRNLERAGIAVYLYLLFGTPPEGESEARRTLDFTARHHSSVSFLNLALFNMPLCGGENVAETGSFYEGDLPLYAPFSHPKGWGRTEVRRFLAEFRRHPAIAPIVRNDPPQFTSNHAPFFTSAYAGLSRSSLSNM